MAELTEKRTRPMGNDYRTERVDRTWMAQEVAHDRDMAVGHRAGAQHHPYDHPPDGAVVVQAHDVAQLLGLQADQVPPAILAALRPLLAELDHLRQAAQQTEHRLARLMREADRDSWLPSLNYHAFTRMVDGLVRAGQIHGTLGVLHVAGIEALGQLYGLAAAQGALAHVADALKAGLRSSDILAHLGLGHFGVVLTGCDRSQAQAKMDDIVSRIVHPAFQWNGQRIPLSPGVGCTVIAEGDSAQAMIQRADAERRGLPIP